MVIKSILPLVVLVCAGCSVSPALESGSAPAQPLGSFALTSARLGNHTVAPTGCSAGEHQLFLGGDFEDEEAGIVVRLAVDPIEGPAVRVFAADAPSARSTVFRREQCRVFHFSLDSTGWRINRIQDYRISLDLDCAAKNGEAIVGKVSAPHCH